MALINRVRQLRTRHGESLAEVAAAVGVSRQQVNLIELGRSAPSAEVMAKIARHFNVAMDDLFFLDGDVVEVKR